MITYTTPKLGTFSVETGVYDKVKLEWIQQQKQYLIIGETADCYTTKYMHSVTGYWDEMGQYETEYTLAIGIHKSRFVQWDR